MYTPVAKRQPTNEAGYTPVDARKPSVNFDLSNLTSFTGSSPAGASEPYSAKSEKALSINPIGIAKFIAQGTAQSGAKLALGAKDILAGQKTPSSLKIDPTSTGLEKDLFRFIFGAEEVTGLAQDVADTELAIKPFVGDAASRFATTPLLIGLTALDFTSGGGKVGVVERLLKLKKAEEVYPILRGMGLSDEVARAYAPKFALATERKVVEAGLESLERLTKTTKSVKPYVPVVEREAVDLATEARKLKGKIPADERLANVSAQYENLNDLVRRMSRDLGDFEKYARKTSTGWELPELGSGLTAAQRTMPEEMLKAKNQQAWFRRFGDGLIGENLKKYGITDYDELREVFTQYMGLKSNKRTVAGEMRSTAQEVRANQKFLSDLSREIQQKIAAKAPLIKQAARFEEKISKINTAKDVLDNRRAFVRAVQKQFGLSDADLRSITQRDIRLMNNVQFKDFLDNIRVRAEKLANKKFEYNRVQSIIQSRELIKTENLQKALKLPTLQNMTEKQLREFADTLEQYKQGDEFLSVRKIETVDNTDLVGIRTIREAKERLAQELGRPIEELDNIKVGALDRFRYDTALAERNPFYGMMVDAVNKALLNAEARFILLEDEINQLLHAGRKTRPRTLLGSFVPQDKQIFKWLEADSATKELLATTMSPEDIKAAQFIQARYTDMRDYLVQHEVLKKYRQDYITHIKRGFLEQWKEDGLLSAFKNVFKQYQDEQAIFNIIDDTGQVLPLEKFFQFSMKRTGGLKPTENVASAFLAYAKAFEKKVALDSIIPKLDIYAHSLTPRVLTPRGLEFDRSLKTFVNEFLNTKKGRTAKIVGIEQGGKIDLILRAGKMFTAMLDLGLNIPVGISARFGENATNFVQLGSRKYMSGLLRTRTAQGKSIIEAYKNFIGKTPFEELRNASEGLLGKAGKVLFGLFQDATVKANKTFLLGSMTEQEFKSGVISGERLAELTREMGRFRVVAGAKSIFGATSTGGVFTQYKSWAIPIVRTVADDITKIIKNRDFTGREAQELLRAALSTLSVVFVVKGLIGDEEDKSFIGTIVNKAYRDAMTLAGALDPKTITSEPRLVSFLGDLGTALSQILTLEQYSENGDRAGDLKGPASLQRALTPRLIKQFIPEETTEPRATRPKTPAGLPELPTLNKALPPLPKLPKLP